MAREDNQPKVTVTSLTGSSNLHYDVMIDNFSDEKSSIHLTGFLNEDQLSWSWTAQTGDDPRLIITQVYSRTETDTKLWLVRLEFAQMYLECPLDVSDSTACLRSGGDIVGDSYKTFDIENHLGTDSYIIFKFTDRQDRVI